MMISEQRQLHARYLNAEPDGRQAEVRFFQESALVVSGPCSKVNDRARIPSRRVLSESSWIGH